ncbi:hypothetical protein KUTeg_000169 [Tegillarca granosa]|uniref:Uncharacterized protein n=1 Tax=Tegillarca granosa TaxID=220873 RepID=A0ABQ9FWS0_TEGGR|nr:hypothetical protein KUTeg_000169 [Tegillarca granosa]
MLTSLYMDDLMMEHCVKECEDCEDAIIRVLLEAMFDCERYVKINSTALPWTTEDIKAVERRLHKFLQLLKTAGKKDCEEATSKEKVLNNRSWEKIQHYIRNRNIKLSSAFK